MEKDDFVYYFRRRNDGAWRGRIIKIKNNSASVFLVSDNWGCRFVAPVGSRQIVYVHTSRLQIIGDIKILADCKAYDAEIPEIRIALQKQHRAQKRKDKKAA